MSRKALISRKALYSCKALISRKALFSHKALISRKAYNSHKECDEFQWPNSGTLIDSLVELDTAKNTSLRVVLAGSGLQQGRHKITTKPKGRNIAAML